MKVEIGKYKISYTDAQRLTDIAKKIDKNKEDLSENEEKEIEKALDGCKGDIKCAEVMLRKIVLGANFIPETINIPAGKFPMGSIDGDADSQPVRDVKISAFKMGKYEVTNEEYRAYLKAKGQEIPESVADEKLSRHPVVNVTWNDAVKYCEWLSKETGRRFRLPTEAEWEYAARGPKGNKYPWGNEWDASKATFDANGTTPVDAHPEGKSPFGMMNMAGNVYEWVGDWHAEYNSKDIVDPKGPNSGKLKVVRGGAWFLNFPDGLPSAFRFEFIPGVRDDFLGFRVAADLK